MSRRRIFNRRTNPRGMHLPLGLILVAIAISLCLLIPSTPLNIASKDVSDKPLPTALGTITRPPPPTPEHIGHIIFTCTRGDFNQLCMVNADGTGYQQLTNLQANSYYPVFAPKGGSVVYASNQEGGVFDLFLFMFDGAKLIQLTKQIGNVVSPTFSPDGKKILFANRAGGPLSTYNVRRTFREFLVLAGLAETGISLRWYRRTGATVIARAVGTDAAAVFLGHASSAITEGHYIEPDRSVDPAPAAHLDRTLRPADPDGSLLAHRPADREEELLAAVDREDREGRDGHAVA